MVASVGFQFLLPLFLEVADHTFSLAVDVITWPCATSCCVLTNNTRLGSKAKLSLPLGTTIYQGLARCNYHSSGTETEPESLSHPSPPPHIPSPRLLAVCQGAEAVQPNSYGPEKLFMPEEEVRSHGKLAESSLDLCPARKSAWDVRLMIGNLFVLSLKRMVVF